MASSFAPELLRRQWPFQAWHDFDQGAWKQCKDAALSAQLSSVPGVRLLGNDIHEGALLLCKKDAKTAGVLHLLELSCEDCQSYGHPPAVPSLVVTNPPWGTRLANEFSDGESEWLATPDMANAGPQSLKYTISQVENTIWCLPLYLWREV